MRYLAIFFCLLSLNVCIAQPRSLSGADKAAAIKLAKTFPELSSAGYSSGWDTSVRFRYAPATDSNLVRLRATLQLDRVAGQGSDLARLSRLLHWVHNAVPHADEYNLPELNALHIITTYRETGVSQGCYGIAITLNEMLLSMGFSSRIVICYPDQATSAEGHVINAVYLESLKRWVWVDPQFDTFLWRSDGGLMGIDEARNALAAGTAVAVSRSCALHGKAVSGRYYFYQFMGQNLYRLISPVYSGYNSETVTSCTERAYIELKPAADHRVAVWGTGAAGPGIRVYHTSSNTAFWQPPR